MQQKAILLLDFDLTIAETDYPAIHGLKYQAKDFINKLYSEGFYIIVNTCRSGKFEDEAKQYLIDQGVNFHLINQNHPGLIEAFGGDSRKLSGDINVDDTNIDSLVNPTNLNWVEVYNNIHRVINLPNFKSRLHYVKN
jgi:hypothetical protein